jgi:hypothetical protein
VLGAAGPGKDVREVALEPGELEREPRVRNAREHADAPARAKEELLRDDRALRRTERACRAWRQMIAVMLDRNVTSEELVDKVAEVEAAVSVELALSLALLAGEAKREEVTVRLSAASAPPFSVDDHMCATHIHTDDSARIERAERDRPQRRVVRGRSRKAAVGRGKHADGLNGVAERERTAAWERCECGHDVVVIPL